MSRQHTKSNSGQNWSSNLVKPTNKQATIVQGKTCSQATHGAERPYCVTQHGALLMLLYMATQMMKRSNLANHPNRDHTTSPPVALMLSYKSCQPCVSFLTSRPSCVVSTGAHTCRRMCTPGSYHTGGRLVAKHTSQGHMMTTASSTKQRCKQPEASMQLP